MAKPIKKIVAIGGGEIRTGTTLAIDREIVRLAQKESPQFLFLPTASSDSEDYYAVMDKCYGKKLGCKTDVLYLIKDKPSLKEIEEKILGADIIYIGGGNTLKMMRLWRRIGVDKLLETAWKQGTVLCGISAGSICWFESGHSDSMSFYDPDKWAYINVRGLGFLKGIHCPHYDGKTLGIPRKTHFQKMIQKTGDRGIAIENNCAIEFLDDKYRVINSNNDAKAFTVFKQSGKVLAEQIPQADELTPIASLFKQGSRLI